VRVLIDENIPLQLPPDSRLLVVGDDGSLAPWRS
jgi:hypothetical protein